MAIQVKCVEGSTSGDLKHAILLYENKSNISFASIHGIDIKDEKPRVGVGIPASKEAIVKLFRDLLPNVAAVREILPWNVLSYDHDHLAWYTLPEKRHLYFKSPQIGGEKSASVSLPGLIFIVTQTEWFIYAHKLNSRPLPDTPLFTAPFFNVWKDGKICTGNVTKPIGITPHDIGSWEDAFFRSYFTHPNIREKDQLVKYPAGPFSMWKKLLSGKLKNFPIKALVEDGFNLATRFSQILALGDKYGSA